MHLILALLLVAEPSEAVTACGGLGPHAHCTLTVESRIVFGSCQGARDQPAVCVLETERPPPGPPREAIEACNRLELNTPCSFSPRGSAAVTGTCQKREPAVVPVCVASP